MPLEYVRDTQATTNRVTLVKTQALEEDYKLLSASYEITEGKVSVIEEEDISSSVIKSVRYTLELEEGAKVRFVRSDRRGNKTEREYVCKDGKIFYTVL